MRKGSAASQCTKHRCTLGFDQGEIDMYAFATQDRSHRVLPLVRTLIEAREMQGHRGVREVLRAVWRATRTLIHRTKSCEIFLHVHVGMF